MNRSLVRLLAAAAFSLGLVLFSESPANAFYCWEDGEFCAGNGGTWVVDYSNCWTDPFNQYYVCSATCFYSWGTSPTQCVVV